MEDWNVPVPLKREFPDMHVYEWYRSGNKVIEGDTDMPKSY